MFTGIIEEIGTVRNIRRGRNSVALTIGAPHIVEGTRIGDSIAVNGICLTVTDMQTDSFSADVMHETMNRSSLASLVAGQRVNLERADGRFGGHIVSGHVDGMGQIADIRQDDVAVWYMIRAEDGILRYVVEKGSIAVDGISLTVAKMRDDSFLVSTIPHTVRNTILQDKKLGDRVNLECDVIGKYVERLMQKAEKDEHKSSITMDFLTKYGF